MITILEYINEATRTKLEDDAPTKHLKWKQKDMNGIHEFEVWFTEGNKMHINHNNYGEKIVNVYRSTSVYKPLKRPLGVGVNSIKDFYETIKRNCVDDDGALSTHIFHLIFELYNKYGK